MTTKPLKENLAKSSPASAAIAIAFVALGAALTAGGIYVGETDDAPGAAVLGILLGLGSLVLAVRAVRRKS